MRYFRSVMLFISLPSYALAAPLVSDSEIFDNLRGLNTLRQTLASSLDNQTTPIDESTFQQTCMPVGKELMTWAQQNGYNARQISHKNRNPKNSVSEHEQEIYNIFLREPMKETHVASDPLGSTSKTYYFRIPYEESCHHCHGPKNHRPEFVVKKYPDDKAFDFKKGDLRGLYVINTTTGSAGEKN